MNVLIVDDSSEICTRLAELLSALPGIVRVDAVNGAADARCAIQSHLPDVVIFDLHAPAGYGVELLETLQAAPIPVTTIVLTNDPTPQRRRSCIDAGAHFFFDKAAEFQRAVDVVAGLARGAAWASADRGWTTVKDALRASQQRYHELFENAPAAIFTTDLDLNVTAMNGAAQLLTGYRREDMKGLNLAALVSAATLEVVRRKLEEQRAGRPAAMYETEIVTRTGLQVPVEVIGRLVYRDGKPIGTLGIARDISHRRRLEQELRQAQKMEAIGRLCGGIAHDFNNLLTIIMGHSQEIVARLPADDPSREDALQVINAGEQAVGMTRKLLAFSGRETVASHVLDVNAAIGALMPTVRQLVADRVTLDLRLGPERYAIEAGAGQIEQVIINLAANACDAMPRGGALAIETGGVIIAPSAKVERSVIAPGRYVLLVVSDTGHGMDSLTKAHLYEPFFTTKESGGGSGLGLSTVYGIVKQNDGHIFIDSDPGCGTTVRVYFPRRPAEEIAPAPATPTPPRFTARGSECVLLVDDDQGVRLLAARVLTSRGYTVLSAASANDAIAIAEQHERPIDLLLVDTVMMGSSGRALTTALRQSSPGLKVLYMSAYTREAILEFGLLDPPVAFIGKPFSGPQLADKVRETLRRPPNGAGGPSNTPS